VLIEATETVADAEDLSQAVGDLSPKGHVNNVKVIPTYIIFPAYMIIPTYMVVMRQFQ